MSLLCNWSPEPGSEESQDQEFRTTQALKTYQQASEIFRSLGNLSGLASSQYGAGYLYATKYQMVKALEFYEPALKIRREIGDLHGEARTLNAMGGTKEVLGNNNDAFQLHQKAMALWRSKKDSINEANTRNNIGLIYDDWGEFQKAIDSYSEAISVYKALARRDPRTRRKEAVTLNNLGGLYQTLGEFQRAVEYFNKALEIFHEIKSEKEEGTTLSLLGYGRFLQGDYQGALDYLKRAYPLQERGGEPKVADPYTMMGMAQAALKQYENASENYQRALKIQQDPAGNSLIGQGITLDKLGQLQQLMGDTKTAVETYGKALEIRSGTQISSLEKEIDSIASDIDQVRSEIRRQNPHFAELTQPRPLSLGEIQRQALDEDTLLLEFSLGEERSYLWAVTSTSFASFDLPRRVDIEEAAKDLYDLITQQELAPEAEHRQAASRLSEMLLGTVAEQIKGKRLLIVPDCALQYIPFSVLPIPAKPEFTPLIVEHEIINLPSATTLAVMRHEISGRQPAAKQIAVLADPVFDNHDERLKLTSNKSGPGKQNYTKSGKTANANGKDQSKPSHELLASITRVANRIMTDEMIVQSEPVPARFFYNTARYVFLEYLKKREKEQAPIDELPASRHPSIHPNELMRKEAERLERL